MTVGQRIAKCRKNKNISQEQLAEMLEVSRQTVSKWETDVTAPDTGNMIWLSKIFEVSVEYIACGGEGVIYDAPLVDANKNDAPKEVDYEDDEESEEEAKERLDKRKFWGFVLLISGITIAVRFLNTSIGVGTNNAEGLGMIIGVALITLIPIIFGLKLLLDKG